MHSLIIAAVLLASTGGTPSWFPKAVERAVVRGDLEDLRSMRVDLLERLDAGEAPSEIRYDFAYVNWRICQILGDGARKERKKLLKEAQRQLEAILEIDPVDAEALALRGSVVGERINGFFSGMFLAKKANGSLKRAEAIEPKNPRIALQRGVAIYFTPKAFGGGLDAAEQTFRRSMELFEAEGPAKAWPNWGRVDAMAWLGLVLTAQGRADEARAMFDKALALEPEHAWILEELLPALDKVAGGVPVR